MKRKIRKNVFETNSSSSHSLTIDKEGVTEYLHVDTSSNLVVVNLDEFGWGYDTYNDPETKLSYLLTLLKEYTVASCPDELYETREFKEINDIVSERCECDGITIHDFDGYVDHQSVDTIDALMKENDCTIEEFIFDPGITLVIDNDNH